MDGLPLFRLVRVGAWLHVVHHVEVLHQVVLKRSAGEQQPSLCGDASKRLTQRGLFVLDAMRLQWMVGSWHVLADGHLCSSGRRCGPGQV